MKNGIVFRNQLLGSFILVLLSLNSCKTTTTTTSEKEHLDANFSFGLIADCQYCNVVGKGQRKYSQSDQKLQSCVDQFNTMDLSWVIHLGDFIDKDWESFDVVDPIYRHWERRR
jgi:manganese-dependent ADP-ribose/CDP-alcohol diphosphatase